MTKVPVGVTSVAGYTVTLAGVVGAVLAFLKGDRSDQTLGVLAASGVAALAFLSTQLGRYAQAHALASAPRPPTADITFGPRTGIGTTGNVQTTGFTQQVQGVGNEGRELTDAELEDDPDMGEPLDATPESYVGDPKDKHGAEDHPA